MKVHFRKLIVGLVMMMGLLVFGGGEVRAQEEEVNPLDMVDICNNLVDGEAKSKCLACAGSEQMWTAVGCLPTSMDQLAPKLIEILMGVAGLLLTVQILVGSAQIVFSSGDSGALNKAKTRIINSTIALLFIIFGVVILRIIGVDIFKIPGFFD